MSFEPFTVVCFTCGSQLRVTNPSLVGTISTCPKCGSMVQIDAPPQAVAAEGMAVGGDGIDSEAITRDAVEPPPQIGGAPPEGGFAVGPDEAFAVADDSSEPLPPAWQSERTERLRHVALIVALSLGGLTVAAALFGWFVQSWRQRDGDEVTVAQTVDEARPENEAAPQPDAASDSTADPSASAEPLGGGDGELPPEVKPDAQQPGAAKDDSSPPTGEPDGSETASEPDGDSVSEPDGRQTPSKSRIPPGLLPASPLEEPRDPVTPDFSKADDGAPGMLDLPPGLKQFTPLLDLDRQTADVTPKLETPALDDVLLDEAREEVVDPMMEAKPLPPVDIERAMGMELAFATEGYPLSDFVLVVSQLTGVPIQIDWVSFDLTGTDVRSTVRPPQRMAPAATQLAAVAAELDAEIQREEGWLVITPAEERLREAVEQLTDFEDLGGDRVSAVAVLNRFLHPEPLPEPETAAGEALPDDETLVGQTDSLPESTRPKLEADEVQLGGDRRQWQLAGIAAESLRRMRGEAGKLSDESLLRWAAPVSAGDSWSTSEGGQPTPTPETAVSVTQWLREIARRNDATCLINWPDALRRQLPPEHLVMTLPQPDAATQLRETLEPFGLTIRVVSPGYWWVGTPATYDRLPVVAWTEPLGERRERLQARLEAAMKGAGPNHFRFQYDPVSDRALMLLPRFILRQFADLAGE